MPRVSGFQVLSWIKHQPGLAALRVLVLTSSEDLRDVNEAYRLGANSFLVKPLDFQDFTSLSRLINDFWLGASKAPELYRPPRVKQGDQSGQDSSTNGKNLS
jgi:DNA-binding NarL/FixJ family response regulator